MTKIKSIKAHKVLNSRADWTVCATVELEDGSKASQTIPEGASKGEHEAISLSVDKAIENIKIDIAPALMGEDPYNQIKIDQLLLKLDGTNNKSNLGGNAILPVSLAVAKAAAVSKGEELYRYLGKLYGRSEEIKFPTPVFNILNGGKHAYNGLSFQEFMVIPGMGFSYEKKLEIGAECYGELANALKEENYSTAVGDEGGFAPQGISVTTALKKLGESVRGAGYALGKEVFLGTDVAAGSFYNPDTGVYNLENQKKEFTTQEFTDFYDALLKEYPLIYLEDPLFESDLASWTGFFAHFERRTMVVGDDLVVTNPKILEEVLEEKAINAVIVKPNQVGSLSETFEFVRKAQEHGLVTVVSHRSGDTAEDTFISDLALAVGADFVKFGAPARGERVVKYNRILDIYHDLN